MKQLGSFSTMCRFALLAATMVVLPVAGLQAAEKTAKAAKPYPLDVCLASGEAFGGDMGEPVVFVYKSQEIKLCCKDCLGEFNKDKDGVLKKVAAASEKK